MRELRPRSKKSPEKELRAKDLCNGPSKLCQSLAITKDNCNELDMTAEEADLWVEDAPDLPEERIYTSTRIGIGGYGEYYASLPYRFYERDNDNVSVLDKRDKEERKARVAAERKRRMAASKRKAEDAEGESPKKVSAKETL